MTRNAQHTRRRPRSNPRGVLRVSAAGYGFVRTAEGEFFVPEARMGGAFDGDTVELVPYASSADKRQNPGSSTVCHARVVSVVERVHDTIVGRAEKAEPFIVVVPSDPRLHHDIFCLPKAGGVFSYEAIEEGSVVRVRIDTFPGRNTAATGTILEVIATDESQAASDVIIARHKLETAFSSPALQEAQACHSDINAAFAAGYRDLRGRFMVTIDPEDAKDFDDGISFAALDGGCARLGVHIADVSAYVPWDSFLDCEARRRATSVYMVDRVLPMLPERLSHDLCSLRPGAERLSMTVDLYLDAQGRVVKREIYPAVVCSAARLTYPQADELLESAHVPAERAEVAKLLRGVHAIAQRRSAERHARGGIEFDSAEAKVVLDGQGSPIDIVLREKTPATSLIEEAMLLANEEVARFLVQREAVSAYRVHEAPSPDNLAELRVILQEFSWFTQVQGEAFACGDSAALQQTLELAKGRREYELVNALVLRAMKRALYRPECEGHFGLALEYYCHFTSPIRRYPDIMVHRALKDALGIAHVRVGDCVQEDCLPWSCPVGHVAQLCEHSSEMERIAQAAEDESREYKVIEYMQDRVGQSFEGIISGVVSNGLYVRLPNTAEGYVDVTALPREYYTYDSSRHALIGDESLIEYRLGCPLRIRVKAANPAARQLIFTL